MRQAPRSDPSFAGRFLRSFFSDIFRDFVPRDPDLNEKHRKLDEKIKDKLNSNGITDFTNLKTLEGKRVLLDALNHEKAIANPNHIVHLSKLLQSDHSIDHYMISSSTNFLNDFFSTKSDALDEQYPIQEQQTAKGQLVNRLKNQMNFAEIYSSLKDIRDESCEKILTEISDKKLIRTTLYKYQNTTNPQFTRDLTSQKKEFTDDQQMVWTLESLLSQMSKINEPINEPNQVDKIKSQEISVEDGLKKLLKIDDLAPIPDDKKPLLLRILKNADRVLTSTDLEKKSSELENQQEELKFLVDLLKDPSSKPSIKEVLIDKIAEGNQLPLDKIKDYLKDASEDDCLIMLKKINDSQDQHLEKSSSKQDNYPLLPNEKIMSALENYAKPNEKKGATFIGLFSKKGSEPSPIDRFIDTFEKFGKEKPRTSIIPLSYIQIFLSKGKVSPSPER